MEEERKKLSVSQINTMIKAAGFKWEADQTSQISHLSEYEQNLRLGLEVREDEMQRIELALTKKLPTFEFTRERDWSKKDGENWVTDVKDQGGCGSCVAFATIATIECQARIQYKIHSWDIRLSEADLFFCGAGRKCQQGWWPSYALDYAKNIGISDADCFPYIDQDMDCKLCDDKAERLLKIGQWKEIINIAERKEWLDKKGPLVACMAVYRDFFSYKDGVYRHVTGDLAGYHAVACIGYSEDEQCWICKNSWNTNWGDKGFFKIGYGEADIDTRFAMYGVGDITGSLAPTEDTEEWDWAEYVTIENNFKSNTSILWAYVNGKWCRRIVSDEQLTGICNVLFNTNSIKVCYKGDEIINVRGCKKLP